MSFVRLDSGEFPPLGQLSIKNKKQNDRKQNGHHSKTNGINKKGNIKFGPFVESTPHENEFEHDHEDQAPDANLRSVINNGCDFVRTRVGCQMNVYESDLDKALKSSRVGESCDFIVAPVEPISSSSFEDKSEALTDLVLSADVWHTRVALDIVLDMISYYDAKAVKHFERIFDHAVYLSSPVIIISCPDTDVARTCVASTINHKLGATRHELLFLLKVPFDSERYQYDTSVWNAPNSDSVNSSNSRLEEEQEGIETSHYQNVMQANSSVSSNNCDDLTLWCSSLDLSPKDPESKSNRQWRQWNAIRNHLRPDYRIGVCLLLNGDLPDEEEELSRWYGEPVRMVVIHTDQFVQSPGHNGNLRLTGRLKTFLMQLAVANSMKISFVLESRPKQNIKPYLEYLNSLFSTIKYQNEDRLRPWNDKIQPPLQPLSSNLDSGTYWVFEMDHMKYFQYRDAMILALRKLLSNPNELDRQYILMVLGAGRGPLVDALINAIKAVDTNSRFKIYALDKNPSSVRTLLYKQKNDWADETGLIETQVVEADMRVWRPKEKADIIASELLGSLGDNELSPECLDGVWHFSTPTTISIPQSYSSYLAPICSFRMHQELYRLMNTDPYVFEQIYVCRLTNCYLINKPQVLFTFEHSDLSKFPEDRDNERYINMTFYSKVDTVCHGFAGYFLANLFGHIAISTLHENKTENMDSWFPAYVPLKEPVQMPKGTKLVVHFWRKESATSVWYEWVITSPIQSRVYSLRGLHSAMSKFI